MNTTGPLAFNRVIRNTNIPFKQLPSSKLNPYTLCEREYNKPNTLMKPLEGSSWVGGAASVYQWCYCQSINGVNYMVIVGIIIVLILLLVLMLFFGLL